MTQTPNEIKKTPLRKAVDYLKSEKLIEQDGDLAKKYGLTPGTVSSYLSGKPGKDFVKNFERDFEISLKDFEEDDVPKYKTATQNEKLSVQTLYKLANANEKLADANQRLTIMLQKNETTANAGQQTPEVSDAMIDGLLGLINDVSQGKKFASKREALTAIHNALHGSLQNETARDTQKG
jgi:predicted transcriptional regulator